MKLNPTEKNALQAVEYLLWMMKIKVSSQGIREELVMHPDFPSMASVSDAFATWQVPNMAVRIQTSQLKEIPLPALVYLNLRGGVLAPVKSITPDTVEWLDTKKGWQKDSIFDFQEDWNGVILLLEPNDQSGEERYSERSKGQFIHNARTPFLILGAAICLSITLSLNGNMLPSLGLWFSFLLGIKTIGMLVAGILLWQSLDADNPFLQNICQLGNQSNCNSILQSKASKITPWLSWSEVGFIYFAGGVLALILASLSSDLSLVTHLFLFSLAALPYTCYSVWYQAFVAKEWCILCMLVQALLWIESAIIITHFNSLQWIWSREILTLLMLAFLIPTLIWILVKKPFTESVQLFEIQRELQKVKFNEDYIQATFNNQTKMPPIFEDMQTAAIGNPDAPHVLTVVTNPLCGPCSRLHGEINQLIESHNNFQCEFVFLGSQKALQIAAILLASNQTDRKDIMESWYSNIYQSQEMWIKNQNVNIKPEEMMAQFRLHGRWCELAGIIGTPTMYINGVKLPTAFRIRDLNRVMPLLTRVEGSQLIS